VKYREASEELKRKIDRRIVEVHEQNPKWRSGKIATLVSKEFEIEVSRSVVERNIPEWRERRREWNRMYRERHGGVTELRKMWRERVGPYGREILRTYILNEELGDNEIVRMMQGKFGNIISERRLRTIVRYCRAVRRGDGKVLRYFSKLSDYLGLPLPVIREELGIGCKIYVGRARKVYECLVALGGVATFKELQERLSWDPGALSNCLIYIKRRGLLISGGRRFIRSLLPDFTALSERLTIWYLPERQGEAEERARQIALEKFGLSFRSHFRNYYKAERSRKEAYRVIPLLREAYEQRSIFTAKELINKSGCGIDAESLEKALKDYARYKRSLHNSGPYFSFWEEDLLCLRKVLELLLLE
jgi:hypothetical protein